MTSQAEFNKMAFERARLVDSYCNLAIKLEQIMEDVRYNISRARNTNGRLFPTPNPGVMQLEAATRVVINDDLFSLLHGKDDLNLVKESTNEPSTNEDSDAKEAKTLHQGSFRPFGILEPESIKIARKEAAQCLSLTCEMAGIRAKISGIDRRLEELSNGSPQLIEEMKKLIL